MRNRPRRSDRPLRSDRTWRSWLLLCAIGALCALWQSACQAPDAFKGQPPATIVAADYPQQLSRWNLLRRVDARLTLNPQAVPYRVNMPLFSDYASKHRALWLPEGSQLEVAADESLRFPVGAVISKTFYYQDTHALPGYPPVSATYALAPRSRVLETRLLVREPGGWTPLSYLWDEAGDDARLIRTGAVIPIARSDDSDATFPYIVPTGNECAKCHALDHASGQLKPIGLTLAQITPTAAADNPALARITSRGWISSEGAAEPMPTWFGRRPEQNPSAMTAEMTSAITSDSNSDITSARARAYLDVNCAHCHSRSGSAKNSGLYLDRDSTDRAGLGICKAPIAAGKGSGGHLYSIVPGLADRSILSYRMASEDPSRRMPETGRTLVHGQGLALVNEWINSLSGDCL